MTLDSEDEIKKALDIDSWRNLSRDKVVRFAALMPEMSKDVTLKIIEQFPKFKDFALDTLSVVQKEHESTLESNEKSQAHVHNAYREVRKILTSELERDDLSTEDRKIILEQIMKTGEKEFDKDTENKRFVDGLFKKALIGAGAAVAAGLVYVGGRIALERGDEIV